MKRNIYKILLTLLLCLGLTVRFTPWPAIEVGTDVYAMDDDDDYSDWDIDDWIDYFEDEGFDVEVWTSAEDFFENADPGLIDDVLESLDELDYESNYIEEIREDFLEKNEEYAERESTSNQPVEYIQVQGPEDFNRDCNCYKSEMREELKETPGNEDRNNNGIKDSTEDLNHNGINDFEENNTGNNGYPGDYYDEITKSDPEGTEDPEPDPDDPDDNYTYDCAGIRDGDAYRDKCGICVGGTTGLKACDECEGEKCTVCGKYKTDSNAPQLRAGNSSCQPCICPKDCQQAGQQVSNLLQLTTKDGVPVISQQIQGLQTMASSGNPQSYIAIGSPKNMDPAETISYTAGGITTSGVGGVDNINGIDAARNNLYTDLGYFDPFGGKMPPSIYGVAMNMAPGQTFYTDRQMVELLSIADRQASFQSLYLIGENTAYDVRVNTSTPMAGDMSRYITDPGSYFDANGNFLQGTAPYDAYFLALQNLIDNNSEGRSDTEIDLLARAYMYEATLNLVLFEGTLDKNGNFVFQQVQLDKNPQNNTFTEKRCK